MIGFSSQLASAVSMGREDTSLIMLSVSFSKDNLWKDQISLTRKLLKVRVEEGEKRERGKKKRKSSQAWGKQLEDEELQQQPQQQQLPRHASQPHTQLTAS